MSKINVFLTSFDSRNKPIPLLSLLNTNEKNNNFTTDDLIKNTIKINKKVYSKRKLYLILPNELAKNYINMKMNFFIYFPIKYYMEKINDLKKEKEEINLLYEKKNIILCNNIKEICFEVCKYLNLDLDNNSYKINLYNSNLILIYTNKELYNENNHIIYVKILKYPINKIINNKYNNLNFLTSSEKFYKKNKKYFVKNTKLKLYNIFSDNDIKNKINNNTSYINTTSNNNEEYSYRFNKTSNALFNNYNKINILDNDSNNGDYNISNLKLKENVNITPKSFDYTSIPLKNKFVKNIFKKTHLIRNNYYQNKYFLKNMKIKNLKFEEKKKPDYLFLNYINLNKELILEKKEKEKLEQNRFDFYEFHIELIDFINKKINYYLTNGEISLYKLLTCNFILYNEMKNYPLIIYRKEFLFYSYLSKFINENEIDFCKEFYLFLNSNKYKNFNFLIQLKTFDNFFKHIIEAFNFIKDNKQKILNQIKSDDSKISISFLFLIIFLILNKKPTLNTNKEVLFLILKSLKINFGNNIYFHDYCYFKLILNYKNKNFLNFNKKFLFLKEIINNLFLNKNEEYLFKLINRYFGINIEIMKIIYRNDVISINNETNQKYHQYINYAFDNIINYYGI